jgi:hypothetical protein
MSSNRSNSRSRSVKGIRSFLDPPADSLERPVQPWQQLPIFRSRAAGHLMGLLGITRVEDRLDGEDVEQQARSQAAIDKHQIDGKAHPIFDEPGQFCLHPQAISYRLLQKHGQIQVAAGVFRSPRPRAEEVDGCNRWVRSGHCLHDLFQMLACNQRHIRHAAPLVLISGPQPLSSALPAQLGRVTTVLFSHDSMAASMIS